MSPPHPRWAIRARANFRSKEAGPVDARTARREWLQLAEAIEASGGTVVALPPPDEALTGMPYAAECGQIVDRGDGAPLFVLPRMAHAHRRPEREHWAALARVMGFEVVDPGEGIWEAQGDVAFFDGATLLFFGGRTDEAGMRAAARFFPGERIAVQIREPAFHGNMAALPLPAVDRLLVCPDVIHPASLERLRQRFGAGRLLKVTEEEIRSYATNGLPIGRTWLAPSVVPDRVVALVERAGMTVRRLPMPNLCEKGGGASRCLVSHARVRTGAVRIPEENRLAAIARQIEAE
ncbi:MAG: amidinotransferase [Myxococcaceae bacterium]|nr:amidinotransferase [Myxococcaceae bacterium]